MAVQFSGVLRAAAWAIVVLSLNGCVAFVPDKIHYQWNAEATPECAECVSLGQNDAFVALAFSGGGSRAAVFAAAGAEALHDEGMLESVTHISSVSGGSLAAAHLAAKPVPACQPSDACTNDYFSSFKNAMRRDYLIPTAWRQIFNVNRFLSPTRRINSLREVFDKRFLDKATFGDLDDSLVLLINAASFDTARRFVFSNLALPEPATADRKSEDAVLISSGFSIEDCTRATPDDLPLSLAVASSAAFPPAFGPVSIEVDPACGVDDRRYWHLGDGGILDNSGVETLQEVLLRRAENNDDPSHAVIFAFDAGNGRTAEEFAATRNLRLWTRGPARVHSIAAERADAHRRVAWRHAATELGYPVTIIELRLREAGIENAAWPSSCGMSVRKRGTPQDRLNRVPTSFRISDCDADLVEMAARTLVRRHVADRSIKRSE